MFKENSTITVVFPNDKQAGEVIERILTEVYGTCDSEEIEVKGLVDSPPSKEKGVKIIESTRKVYAKTNSLLTDPRNPYPNRPVYEVFKEKGITCVFDYHGMHLAKTGEDVQKSREFFNDFVRYLVDISNEEYLLNASLDAIKDIILVISTKIYAAPCNEILKQVAMGNVNDFLNTASEQQLRSAAFRILDDTIKFIKR